MNIQMWRDLQSALDDVKNDPQIKVLIITGEGLSTGADLKESKTRSWKRTATISWSFRKPHCGSSD